MSQLGAFCNQLIRFFEELQGSFPEEKGISMALEAIKAGKKSNPRLMLDIFYDNIYVKANDLIINRKDDEVRDLARVVLAQKYNEMMPALMIFDKYWPTMSQDSKDAIWKYLFVLCKLCENVRAEK
jgi:hypothetical protein|uniref:Uncharacterized protein n=1 Tax=viral metagenome TaxID=1070528 RepID=A0A6C0K3A1_9ZZZZ